MEAGTARRAWLASIGVRIVRPLPACALTDNPGQPNSIVAEVERSGTAAASTLL
jgi:hypothetical protein